ncbi:MAG TPA: hypothetical protein VI141_06320, partial [Acidimicrobiia bacterium]
AGTQLAGINTREFFEGQPNVRVDGREIFFYSNRTGTLGGNDIYSSTKSWSADTWGTPQNLGPNVNSAGSETRPSLSLDGRTLYFGSNRADTTSPNGDVYVTKR